MSECLGELFLLRKHDSMLSYKGMYIMLLCSLAVWKLPKYSIYFKIKFVPDYNLN